MGKISVGTGGLIATYVNGSLILEFNLDSYEAIE